jgi:hypothetical protein
MNYQRIYDQICQRAKSELELRKVHKKDGGYYEGHHIIPKCLGGSGWANNYNHQNIALLTAREHFLCHWLLSEIYKDDYKLAKAFYMMCIVKDNNQIRYIPSSKIIEYAKIKSSKLHSNYMKNEFWTDDMKKRMSKSHTGKKHSKESLEKLTLGIKKYFSTISEEDKQKKSLRFTGDNNPSKKIEVREKMKKAALNRKKIKCPHCEKEGPISQMKQWHFDNCKIYNYYPYLQDILS